MKGFTLVEILTVIVILAILILIAIPIVSGVMSSMKDNMYSTQIEKIKESAKMWASDNTSLLPTSNDASITIRLMDLKTGGYVDLLIKDPRTNELFSNDLIIRITKINDEFVYEVEE